MEMVQLTIKQRIFVDEYLTDLNATRAYLAAYKNVKSDKVAAQAGSRLLRNVKVAGYLRARMKDRETRTEISQDKTLKELARIAFFDIRKLFDENDRLKDITDLDENTAAAVISIDSQDIKGPDGKVIGRVRKVRLANKLNALEQLAKHLGLFEKDNRQKGEGMGEAAGEVALSSIERAARLMELVRIAKKRAAEAQKNGQTVRLG
jgi:phage terminase small subunit